jgi:nickel-type superoxide dismutase maturation protease
MVRRHPHPTHCTPPSPRVAAALVGFVGVAAAGAVFIRGFRRVRVIGDSMAPTFSAGDRLLVGPTFRTRAGDVVAVTDPRPGGRLMIKRVRAVDRGWVDVRGDNEAASTDSRQLGLIPRSNLAGRVVYRYAPPDRAGWLPGS